MKLTVLLVTTLLMFSACAKPKIIEKNVYLECECPEIKLPDVNLTTTYEELNIDYEVIDERS